LPITVQTIKDLATEFTGTTVTITNSKAIAAMKLALILIADKNGYDHEIASAGYTAYTWYPNVLPENNMGVTAVNIDDNTLTIYSGWRRRNRDMQFYDSNSYIIHYKALPAEPTTMESTLEVHPIYQDALWEFMIGFARLSKWEGKDEPGSTLIADFRALIDQKYKSINRRTGPARWEVQRHA
jgi:hypothetical protein